MWCGDCLSIEFREIGVDLYVRVLIGQSGAVSAENDALLEATCSENDTHRVVKCENLMIN